MGNLRDAFGMLIDSFKNQNLTLFSERLARLQREGRLLRATLHQGGFLRYVDAAGFWETVDDPSTHGNMSDVMRDRLTRFPYKNFIDNAFQQGLMVDLVMDRRGGLVTEFVVYRPEWVRARAADYGRTFLVSRFVWHRNNWVPA